MRIIKGISALVAVAAIIVGVPAFLLLTIGNPLPGLTELPSLLSRPDYDGTVLFGTIVPILAWLGWAWLTIGILIEALAAARNVQIRRIGLFSPSQGLGSILIGAIVAMGGAVGAIAPANAATPAPQPSSVVQPHTTTSSPAHAAETTATQAGHTRASTQALKVTVKPGDTLWSLAERHLGDGAKFKQIAELNYGHPQPGGGHLTHTHTLEPGWELTLPANATQAPQTHTVQSGETLSSIAKTYLGDADAYPKLLALNPTITNPDQITVGQVLRLPAPITTTAAHTRQQTTTEKKSEPKKPTPTASAGKASKASAADSSAAVEGASAVAKDAVVAGQAVSAAGEAAGAVQAPVEHAGGGASPSAPGSAAAEEDSDGPSVTLRTVGGIGGVLAAGLLALFARRRWHRRRTRKPGAPTPATSHDADLVEARLKDVETPVTSEDIDTTLRYLATWSQQHATELPDLFCVRATDTGSELNLYLVGPATLPVPFTKVTDDNTVWAIIPSELPSTGEGGTPSAPYPGLVTLGHDDNHGQILLDLEQLSTLNITGSQHRATATMNALAVELGVSPWAEDLTVSLVGFLEDLPAALGTGRIRHYEDLDSLLGHLRPYAAGIESDLASAGLQSPRAARVASEEAEAWPPEIVLIGEPGTQEEMAELYALAEHTPRLGIATVTRDGTQGEWTLELTETGGLLNPVAMPLNPQTLSDEESAAIIETLQANTTPEQPEATPEGEPVPAELTLITDTGVDEAAATEEGDPVELEAEACQREDVECDDTEPLDPDAEPALAHTEDPTTDNLEVEVEPSQAETTTATPEPVTEDEARVEVESGDETTTQPDTPNDEPVPEPAPEDEARVTVSADEEEPAATDTDVEPTTNAETPATDTPASTTLDPDTTPDSPTDADEASMEEIPARGPIIRILGPVDVLGATGELPISKSSGKPSPVTAERLTSLIAFLTLHPGANTEQVHHAFWPNKDPNGETPKASRNKLTNQARKYLGTDPAGTAYFPHCGSDGYRLDPRVTTDWDHFQALTGPNPTKTSTPRLLGALRLVRGTPFEDTMTRNYLWNERDRDTIINHISDTATIVMTRALADEDSIAAALAAKVGAMVDPANEETWRNQMRAEALAGNRRGVEEIYQQLIDYLDSFDDGYVPEAETEALYKELARGHRVAS